MEPLLSNVAGVIAVGFLMGALIGFAVVWLAYRSRLLRGAIFGGLGFLLAARLVGWANSHAYYIGERLAENGNSPLRSFVVKYGFAVPFVSSCIAALLAGIGRQESEIRDN
jgi:hypothetical protein